MNLAGLPFWQETEKRWKTQILRWCIGIGRNGEVRSRGKGRSQTQLGSKWGWGAGLKLITIWSDKANVTAATMVYLIGIELRLRIISACYAFRCIMESNHKSILTKAVRMCKAWMHCHVSLGSVPIAAFGAQSMKGVCQKKEHGHTVVTTSKTVQDSESSFCPSNHRNAATWLENVGVINQLCFKTWLLGCF
jgi:hypothetical protein